MLVSLQHRALPETCFNLDAVADVFEEVVFVNLLHLAVDEGLLQLVAAGQQQERTEQQAKRSDLIIHD